MKKKDRNLFDKAIHDIKKVINEIKEERENHHREVSNLRKLELQILREKKVSRVNHDLEMQNHMKELMEIVDKVYELYDSLSDEKGE